MGEKKQFKKNEPKTLFQKFFGTKSFPGNNFFHFGKNFPLKK